MSTSWLLTNLIAEFLLPPLGLLVLGVCGLFLLRRHARTGRALLALSLASLWLLSTPIVADALLDSLKPAFVSPTGEEAEAIVILGGGRVKNSLEYGGDSLGRYTLERVRLGARLARALDKPILVTGGMPDGGDRSEGELMRETLEREFATPVKWVEERSNNTRENARFSAELLKRDGITRIYLVTHAWHLPRAMPEFAAMGLEVFPAGAGYAAGGDLTPLDFLPRASSLANSHAACHEWLGMLWYRLRD